MRTLYTFHFHPWKDYLLLFRNAYIHSLQKPSFKRNDICLFYLPACGKYKKAMITKVQIRWRIKGSPMFKLKPWQAINKNIYYENQLPCTSRIKLSNSLDWFSAGIKHILRAKGVWLSYAHMTAMSAHFFHVFISEQVFWGYNLTSWRLQQSINIKFPTIYNNSDIQI